MKNVKRLLVPRWTIARTGAALGLLGLAGGWYAHINAEPHVTIPPQTPLPSPNARDDYLRGTTLLTDKDAVADALDPKRQLQDKKHVYTAAEKRKFDQENAPALAAVRAGFAHAFGSAHQRRFDERMPEYAQFRAEARLLRLDAEVKAEQDDFAGAFDSGMDAMRLGVDIPRGGVLIADLVGIACETIGRQPLWGWLDHLDDAQAIAAARRLETLDRARIPFADTLTEEKWFGQAGMLHEMRGKNTFQFTNALFTGMGFENNDADAQRARLELCLRMLPYSKQDVLDNSAAYMDALIAQARQPYQQVRTVKTPLPKDPISQILMPVFAQARFKDDTARMQNQLLLGALGLRAYRCRHASANPASLNELVTEGILTRVPFDPFSSSGDAPLRYRRLPDGSCRLYSIGPDGVDDGGRPVDPAKMSATPKERHFVYADDTGDWVLGVNTPPAVEAAR